MSAVSYYETMVTIGQLLDTYLADYRYYETVVFYRDKDGNPRLVVTQSDSGYDYTDVFSTAIDLRSEIDANRKEVRVLRDKIRTLTKEKKQAENAIKRLAKYYPAPQAIKESENA